MGKFKDTGVIIRGTHTADLGALADQAAVKVDGISLDEDFRLLKAEIYAGINGGTADQLDLLYFGMCDGELSAAEIAEAILAEPSDRNDNLGNERAMRPVWVLGAVESRVDQSILNVTFRGAYNSPLMEWKKRWTFFDPEGWDYFVFNNSGSVLTTGADARVVASGYGLWVT